MFKEEANFFRRAVIRNFWSMMLAKKCGSDLAMPVGLRSVADANLL
jgi:hypothetical protein